METMQSGQTFKLGSTAH